MPSFCLRSNITSLGATTFIAPSNLVTNNLIFVGGTLYRVTQNVASGAALVTGSGGNITATTIMAELALLR